jgi:hypothetical protein
MVASAKKVRNPNHVFLEFVGHGNGRIRHRIPVADRFEVNPLVANWFCEVFLGRLTKAILLSVLTCEANLLIIPPNRAAHASHFTCRQ